MAQTVVRQLHGSLSSSSQVTVHPDRTQPSLLTAHVVWLSPMLSNQVWTITNMCIVNNDEQFHTFKTAIHSFISLYKARIVKN